MLKEFFEAFILVFLAEMGDKSQLLALTFATMYPLSTVMAGVAIGIALNHGLAIIFASILASYIDLKYIKLASAIIFIILGLSSLKLEFGEDEDEVKTRAFGPILTIAMTFFVGELGDKTQILAMTMGAKSSNKLLIFIATFSAMLLVSIIGIYVGRILKKKIPEVTLNFIASVFFLIFGLIALYSSFNVFNISTIYFALVFLLIVFFAFGIIGTNDKRKEDYYIAEISKNLANCINCDKSVCKCDTKINIDRLTSEYLGEDINYVGDFIKYMESFKTLPEKSYERITRELYSNENFRKIKRPKN